MQLEPNVRRALETLHRHGHEAYVVGGCVRDSLMGATPKDWDICTSALPDAIAQCFAGHRLIETGRRHGTLTVVLGETPVEITTYRADGPYSDNRRPDAVVFVRSLREDLARRDFTMNAIAYSPAEGFVDPFGGAADIRRGVIRCVGRPDERFREDGLRVLRALRFASRLGFALADDAAAAVHRCRHLLRNLSAERLAAELCGLLEGAHPRAVLLAYADVPAVFIPELAPMVGFAQHHPCHQYDLWRHTVESVAAIESDRALRLAMLLHDIGKPACHTVGIDGTDHFCGHEAAGAEMAQTILNRLRFDNATTGEVVELVRRHGVQIGEDAVARWLNRLGEERFDRLLKVKEADIRALAPACREPGLAHLAALRQKRDALLAEKQCFRLKDLAVNGRDLMALGIAPGARLGEILDALLAAVVDGRLPNERKALLEAARRLY